MNLGDDEETDNSISDILRGMQYAVNSAQESLRRSQLRFMERYFNTDTGEPYTLRVKLPNGKVLNIPEITLIPQNTLLIDEIEMDFSVHVASSKVKEDRDVDLGNDKIKPIKIKRTSLGVFFGHIRRGKNSSDKDKEDGSIEPASDVIQIKIKFKATDEPEATARVRDMLNKTISE